MAALPRWAPARVRSWAPERRHGHEEIRQREELEIVRERRVLTRDSRDELAKGSGAGGSSVRSKVRTTCLVDTGIGLVFPDVAQLVSRPAVRPPCDSAPTTPATPFAMSWRRSSLVGARVVQRCRHTGLAHFDTECLIEQPGRGEAEPVSLPAIGNGGDGQRPAGRDRVVGLATPLRPTTTSRNWLTFASTVRRFPSGNSAAPRRARDRCRTDRWCSGYPGSAGRSRCRRSKTRLGRGAA